MSQSKTQGQTWEKKLGRIAPKFAQTFYALEGKRVVKVRERLEWTRSYSVTLTGGDLMFLHALLGEMAETHGMSDAKRREMANSPQWKHGAANVQTFLGDAMRLREDAVEPVDHDRRDALLRRRRARA